MPPSESGPCKWETCHEISFEILHRNGACRQLLRPGHRPGQGDRRRRRPGQHRRLGRLPRARRNRPEIRLDHQIREGHWLQGQRQDGQHVGRNGRVDERRRFRPRHRVGRRFAAAHRRQAGAANKHRPDQELVDHRRPPQGRAVAHGRRRSLRRALYVGPERPDVQHQRLQGGSDFVESRLRGDDAGRRQVQQGPRAGL